MRPRSLHLEPNFPHAECPALTRSSQARLPLADYSMQELFEHAASDAGAYHRFVDFMSAHTQRDSRRAGLRVALVALTAVAAMVLPNLEQMMSLLGAVRKPACGDLPRHHRHPLPPET